MNAFSWPDIMVNFWTAIVVTAGQAGRGARYSCEEVIEDIDAGTGGVQK